MSGKEKIAFHSTRYAGCGFIPADEKQDVNEVKKQSTLRKQ
jgi:hypothetical protein